MVADRTRELLFPITILVSVAVGVVIGSVLARAEGPGRALTSTTSSDSKAVVDAVDAVRAELVRVRERLDANSMSVAPTEPTVTRTTAAPDATSELHKATAALVQAAETLRSASIGAAGGSPPLIAPKTVDPAIWSELARHSKEENTKTYLLWNYQQVLDRFGPPDTFSPINGATCWSYSGDQEHGATFNFTEGLVASVYNDQ